ncbi:glucose-6-phosphate isomerase [Pontivivens insulae]|uniref:Glucose-6-phosphate isomerase n=1 Tax=Pontivivens insulae TaxID=1639689 RepID=A0A2R8A8D4_9RHOB|nr:glucose-6-phosphate isomerase [Pontivivens insulae]RED18588.1 glucose-6-phosphate isomerase [Pontivivens insulae]SPF28486.1 Glucose-6-phosphate isomerase [Pontivivens insulae]
MSWTDLQAESGHTIAELYDDERFAEFSATYEDMLFDYSRTQMTVAARATLFGMLEDRDFAQKRAAMYGGAKINNTEGRRVLHTALRLPEDAVLDAEGEDIARQVLDSRAACFAFAEDVRSGAYAAAAGSFTDVVNIGIGGSDLGPVLVAEALTAHCDGPRLHFVSNVDGAALTQVFQNCDLSRTLFIIASKSFGTIETMETAKVALARMKSEVADASVHFAALTTKPALAAEQFGIPAERCFGFADWVGGRFSVWSPIGLPLMIGMGTANFSEFLAGAHEIDTHFQSAPLAENLPVLMACVGVWHRNGCGFPTRCVVPYDQRLATLPQYLQQLDMESNGKRVTLDGDEVAVPTSPVVWGSAGTNAQHAYFQMLHQSPTPQPLEFMIAAEPVEEGLEHLQNILIANCFAQNQAFAFGRTEAEAEALMIEDGMDAEEARRLAPHRTFPGNRPSTLLLYRDLTPRTMGRIIALAEARCFTEGVFWGINSFDQWGVELGKVLATGMLPHVEGKFAEDMVNEALSGPLAHLHTL